MQETVMVIPGTEAQVKLIQKLQKMGYRVLCINPQEDSPAFKYSDYIEKGDILDENFCLQMAQQYRIKAIMSDECDIAMPTIGFVSEQLGLPSIGNEMAKLYTNKYEMRKFLKLKNFPCPKYQQCKNVSEALAFFHTLGKKKMIIKPLDSNSSRGVFTITSADMLTELFEKSILYSKTNRAVLCEEYIEGPEFTADGIVINGKHHTLAISKKKHYTYNPNIACELLFTYQDEAIDYEKLRQQNNRYVEETKLPFGFTHAEYKYNGSDFVLVEIGARGGGNFISSYIVPALTGIDTYKILIDAVLLQKQPKCLPEIQNKERTAVLKFFDIDNCGKVKRLEGEYFLKNCPQILLYRFHCKTGDIVQKAINDSTRVGFYIAMAETYTELKKIMEQVAEKVKIVVEEENGNHTGKNY